MSKEDVEKMDADAEKYIQQEDEENRQRIESRNNIENYLYQIQNSLNDEKLKDKFSEEDRETLNTKLSECRNWLDNNATATKEELDDKMKDFQDACMPIMKKLGEAAGGAGGMPGGMPAGMPAGMEGMDMAKMAEMMGGKMPE